MLAHRIEVLKAIDPRSDLYQNFELKNNDDQAATKKP
jgi:hypothetical protein